MRLVQANYKFLCTRENEKKRKKHVKGDVTILQFFLTLGKVQFSKRKRLIDYDDSDNINTNFID